MRKREQLNALIAVASAGFALFGVPALAYLISRLTAQTFGEVVGRLVIAGTGVLVFILAALAYFAKRGKVLTWTQLRGVGAMTAILVAELVALRYVRGWHGEIVLGALLASGLVWTFRVLVFLSRTATERPTAIETSIGGGLTRFGESLLHLGKPLVRLGRTFSIGATLSLCAFFVSLLFLALTLMQTSVLVLPALYTGHSAKQIHKKAGVLGAAAKARKDKKIKTRNPGDSKKAATAAPQAVDPAGPVTTTSTQPSRSWADVCGPRATLPGYELPPVQAVEFQKLFYGPGQPGAEGTGCTGKTQVVPGHPDMRYLVGVDSAGATQSIAIVWSTGPDSYDGALVIAPATDVFWQLVLKSGHVHAVWRIEAGNGDAVVMWSTLGTTILIRSTKTLDGRATPYVVVDPPAADLWLAAVEQHGEWLWPIAAPSAPGTRTFVLVHDPVFEEEVARISYATNETSGSQIALSRIERYAPRTP